MPGWTRPRMGRGKPQAAWNNVWTKRCKNIFRTHGSTKICCKYLLSLCFAFLPNTSDIIALPVNLFPSVSLTHSLTGLIDQWRADVPSRVEDHWPCPKQHRRWTRCRFPADGSRFVEDDRVDVSIPAYRQVGDQNGFWQPGEVLHALVQTLAGDVHVQILKHIGH